MKAMILAAGYGTRLRPITYTLPKPMVPVCNRPLVAWAIDGFIDAGVREFIVNLHHLPGSIERYLRERYADEAKIDFSYEPEILGTGGGVRNVRHLLEGEDEFYLVNGDTIQFAPYGQLHEARRVFDALAALTLRHPPETDRFTAVYYQHGLITGFGKGQGESLMFSGAHLIGRRIFGYLPHKPFSGIVDEVYMPVIENGRDRVAGVIDDGLWYDIGTPQRYLSASAELLSLMVSGAIAPPRGSRVHDGSLLHQTATINGSVERSVIGERSLIRGDVRDSYVWDDCRISGGATIERCIVAHGVEINRPVELRDAMICREDAEIPMDAEYERIEGNVVVRV